MKKFIIVVIIIVALIASLMPLSAIGIRAGFRNPTESWAADAVYFGARLRMRFGCNKTAGFILERALQTWPNDARYDETLYWIALSHERSGGDMLAANWYRRFLREYPHHPWSGQAKRRLDMIEAHNL